MKLFSINDIKEQFNFQLGIVGRNVVKYFMVPLKAFDSQRAALPVDVPCLAELGDYPFQTTNDFDEIDHRFVQFSTKFEVKVRAYPSNIPNEDNNQLCSVIWEEKVNGSWERI